MTYEEMTLKIVLAPLRVKHSLNAAINKLIQVCVTEISFKKCQVLTFCFGWPISHTSRKIYQNHELGSIYWLLRWNHVANPVLFFHSHFLMGNFFFVFNFWWTDLLNKIWAELGFKMMLILFQNKIVCNQLKKNTL